MVKEPKILPDNNLLLKSVDKFQNPHFNNLYYII